MMRQGSWTAPQSTSSCTVIPSAPSLSAYDSAAFGVGLNANTEETEFKSHRKWHEEHEAALNAVSHEITDYFPDIAPSPKSSAPPQRVCDGQLLFDEVTESYSVFTMHSAADPLRSCHFRVFEGEQVRQCLSSRNIWILHESLGRDLYEFMVTAMAPRHYDDDDSLRDQWQQRFESEATATVLNYDQLSLLYDGEGHQFQALGSFQRDGFRFVLLLSLSPTLCTGGHGPSACCVLVSKWLFC